MLLVNSGGKACFNLLVASKIPDAPFLIKSTELSVACLTSLITGSEVNPIVDFGCVLRPWFRDA